MNLCLNMLYILVLCPVLLASPVLTLTIDSQLGTSVEDCFERVSIGEELCVDAIYRNMTELSTKDCEQLCKQDTQCQTYDYGVGAKGNASCNLSKMNLTELQDGKMLQKHSDYDVYIRQVQCDHKPVLINQQQSDNPQNRPMGTEDAGRKPMADDLSPHETTGPASARPFPSNTRPEYDSERPDDYDSYKPSFDGPPSYGMHRPQEIPYRPESPNRFHRPTQNDEINFQSRPIWRPPRPNDKIPDIYRPNPYPEYVPEVPQYVYIERPHRRQHKPSSCSQNKPQEALSDPATSDKPIRPERPERPIRPYQPSYDKPIGPPERPDIPSRPYQPSYSGEYASNYGSSHDNSIYLEIIDPPRPIRPMADENPQRPPNYYYNHDSVYGQEAFDYSSQNYHSQQSESQNYWNGGYQYKPARPYRNPTLDHGSNYEYDERYRPARPIRPIEYGHDYNQASYSESQSSQNYASSHGYYSGSHGDEYNRRPTQQVNKNQTNVDRLSDVNQGHTYSQGGYGSQNANRFSDYGGPSVEEINKYNYEHGIYGTHLGYGTHHLYGITPGMYGPTYVNDRNDRPMNDRPYGGRPYQDYDRRPYGQGTELKPRPIENPDRKPSNPIDNRNQTNSTAPNNSSRPDVRPVYEQDGDRPYNVPSYLVTSNGNVVTSKPVAVADFGSRPGYRRDEATYEATRTASAQASR